MDLEPVSIIRTLRDAGWTVAAIAAAIGTSEREVYRWAQGVRPITPYRRALERLIHVTAQAERAA
jgi:transcriptional regulator with XRE-family HTH domain